MSSYQCGIVYLKLLSNSVERIHTNLIRSHWIVATLIQAHMAARLLLWPSCIVTVSLRSRICTYLRRSARSTTAQDQYQANWPLVTILSQLTTTLSHQSTTSLPYYCNQLLKTRYWLCVLIYYWVPPAHDDSSRRQENEQGVYRYRSIFPVWHEANVSSPFCPLHTNCPLAFTRSAYTFYSLSRWLMTCRWVACDQYFGLVVYRQTRPLVDRWFAFVFDRNSSRI